MRVSHVHIVLLCMVALFILFVLLLHHRMTKSRRRVSDMPYYEKNNLLNDLARPFGFSYLFTQDIFTSRIDAPQRKFGYGTLYDLTAPSMNMVFDFEPVYFNYQGKTWLIEFWKGQYGICTGAEVGIYHADSIVPPLLRPQTIFPSAAPEEMLPVKIRLKHAEGVLFNIERPHWWLTGFLMGTYRLPEDQTLEASIVFPDEDMCDAFVHSLKQIGYESSELIVGCCTVQFSLTEPKSTPDFLYDTWIKNYVLWKTRMYCRLYLWVTKPFDMTVDRLLYLYYVVPAFFRRVLRIRTFGKKRRRHL
ncbi:DUF4474 domain-containing protein [Clostridium sp. C105KSO13]|uniref:DUF4474 domain-containing protein n=1 Tax=Clostridium sp. C105KSO13 TaxID=1776045 RepID=UPI00074089A4|nr:DUF4474 domain-containing protein [Clostridium sp. C105KSO13]CUX34199.1 hypothetical protein BN3456_01556 [Clostridium sp. C105KSO13]